MKDYNARTWVSFKELRARLRFEDVLKLHKVVIARKGEQHQGPCPLPSHGERPNVAPFSAHLGRGIFRCFGCQASGNLIEFSALMEGVDPEDGAALRRVAVALQEEFCPDGKAGKPKAAEATRGEPPPAPRPAPRAEPREALVNAPLDFELKDLEHNHPALTGGRLELRTVVHFGAGFCSRGLLRGKVAVPLHDPEGRLVGYAGTDAGGSAIDRCAPEWSFPEGRERKGVRLEFRPELLLYNAHRVGRDLDELIVAPNPVAVWWLHQCGWRHAVSPLGGECSERQAELIASLLRPSGRLWILPDGGADGERAASSVLSRLSRLRFARVAAAPRDRPATDLFKDELEACLSC